MPLAAVWLVVMVGVAYFLLWRPQQRRMANMRSLQQSISLGDEVMTTSGIFGIVRALREDHIELEIAPNVTIRVARGAIGQRLTNDNDAGQGHDGAGGLEETG